MGRAATHRNRRPVAIDLYAGAGGLSLGMEQAGFDVIGAVEMDPIHAQVHRYNFPRTPVLSADLNAVDASDLRQLAQEGWIASGHVGQVTIDAVVGGPPCQGFSVGGVRKSDDERNNQLLRFIDLVIALRPKVFCLENVAGLLESRFDALRQRAAERLATAGYSVSGFDQPLNAADFGVPQSRRRVLIMGGLDSSPSLGTGTAKQVTVADALAGLPDLVGYGRLLKDDEVRLREEHIEALVNPNSSYASCLVGVDADPLDMSHPRKRDYSLLTNSLRTVHAPKTVQRFRRTEPGHVEKVSRLFRLSPEGLARTLRAGTGTDRGSHTSPRPIHPSKSRVITVREAARLHGYPDWFRFHGTNWHGHRQVGNSVPPPLAAAAGRALVEALRCTVARPTEVMSLGDPGWLWHNRTEAVVSQAVIEGVSPGSESASLLLAI